MAWRKALLATVAIFMLWTLSGAVLRAFLDSAASITGETVYFMSLLQLVIFAIGTFFIVLVTVRSVRKQDAKNVPIHPLKSSGNQRPLIKSE